MKPADAHWLRRLEYALDGDVKALREHDKRIQVCVAGSGTSFWALLMAGYRISVRSSRTFPWPEGAGTASSTVAVPTRKALRLSR